MKGMVILAPKNKMKKKKNVYRIDDPALFFKESQSDRIKKTSMTDYNTERMKKYGINVIMSRFVPQAVDGLKPVERRILYSLYINLKKNHRKKIKMGEAVAACLNIHPHGDSSVVSTTVRLGQPWQNMIPTIETHDQNFGTIKGDGGAAARYLSVSLSNYAIDCFFSDFNEDLVDMIPSSANEDYMEPLTLPAKYPNILINGATGMAYGIATNIPCYNVKELLEYTIKLIDNPKLKGYLIPDSPTSCVIIDQPEAFKSIHETGRGVYKMRSEFIIDEENHKIIICSIPFQTNFMKMKQAIVKLKEEKVLSGLINMEDNSGAEHIDLTLTFKKEVNLHEVKKLLTNKKHFIENYYPAQIKVIHNLSVQHFSIKELLQHWIEQRRDYKQQSYHMKLVKIKAREHVLETMLEIMDKDNAERTLKIIKKSEDDKEIVEKLVSAYGITTMRAKSISDLKLSAFSKKAIARYKEELKGIEPVIKNFKSYINNPELIDEEIKEELSVGIKRYGVPRESIIMKDDSDVVMDTQHTLVITEQGKVKKLAEDVKRIGTIANGDIPVDILKVSNLDKLIMFDDCGVVHTVNVSDIRSVDLSSVGLPLNSFTRSKHSYNKFVSIFIADIDGNLKYDYFKDIEDSYFIFTTKFGLIKKTPYSEYSDLKQAVIAINLNKDDSVVDVQYVNKDRNILVYSHLGYGLLFNSTDITETKRVSKGVKAFELVKHDGIRSTAIVGNNDSHIAIFTERGYCKRLTLDTIPRQDRKSDANKLINLDDGDPLCYIDSCNNNDTYRVYSTGEFVDVHCKEIPEMYRLNKGKKIVPLKKGQNIFKITRL